MIMVTLFLTCPPSHTYIQHFIVSSRAVLIFRCHFKLNHGAPVFMTRFRCCGPPVMSKSVSALTKVFQKCKNNKYWIKRPFYSHLSNRFLKAVPLFSLYSPVLWS